MKYVLIAVLAAVLLVPSSAVARDDGVNGGVQAGTFVEVFDIHRYDSTNTSGSWDQTDDELRNYYCFWADSQSIVCEDQHEGAVYACTFYNNGTDNGRVSCQYAGAGAMALSPTTRQARANELARGIGNRGQIACQPYELPHG